MSSTGIQHDFLDPPKDSEELGSLGHYRVVNQLGKGGMGYVFLAEDTRLKRQVALKVMNQKIAATPGSRKRFISEARSMAAVHHDNVATIFEVGEHKGTPYMAMELLEGATLENFRERNGEPDFKLIIAYARDIARGLAAAHAQGIVHRDIKPANIWLDTKTNRIKILDFGLALAQTPVDQLSGRGAVVGTPGYLSPEQARSEPLDDRSDLYSAGVVLYELATGSLPLKSKTVAEQLIAILAHEPKPLRERNEKIPQPLADLIHQLMAKEPRDRFANASDLESRLDVVEVECEKKTEVAQAINQLQLGLEQAVSKKSTAPGGLAMGMQSPTQSQPNPFDSLPDSLPAAAPIAAGVDGSGIHAAVPTAASPLAGGSSGNRKGVASRSKPATPTSQSKVIWIAVGVVAVLLLVLVPLIVFLSDSSAIARQQNQNSIVVNSDTNNSNANTDSNSAVAEPENKSKPPAQQRSTPQSPANRTPNTKPLGSPGPVTMVSVSSPKELGGQGFKWILGNKQANGSFEQSEVTQDQKQIPGWAITVNGPNGGWGKANNAKQAEAKTFAFAGRKSEIRLTSNPLKHQAKAGDIFRVAANIGGDGRGNSNYQVVLGFRSDFGEPVRFQLDERSDSAKWSGGKQTRLMYEYVADDSVAGRKPFVEFTVSNMKGNRNRAMLDRVVVTVRSAGATKPPTRMADTPTTPAVPKTTPPASSVVSLKPSATKTPETTPPKSTGPEIANFVTLKTSDEGGADTTVKRGGSSNSPLGEKPSLAIQTRNNRQIQHVYLRFPLGDLRPNRQAGNRNSGRGNGQNAGSKPIPVGTAELQLTLTGPKRKSDAKIRVFGLDQSISDRWPENKIVWSNSLSSKDLSTLPMLAEETVGRETQNLTISGPLLADFIAKSGQQSITLILTGSDGNEMFTFASKEDSGKSPPTLVLGMTR